MRVKLFTFRYSATLGGFDETTLQAFVRDKEVVAFREHFFSVNDVPHLTCVLTWQDAVVADEDLEAARCAAEAHSRHRARRTDSRGHRPDPTAGLDESDRALFNTLREWRLETAREEGVPPYLIFANRHLVQIVVAKPDSPTALGNLSGIGKGKVERYGTQVLGLLGTAQTPDPTGEPTGEPPA